MILWFVNIAVRFTSLLFIAENSMLLYTSFPLSKSWTFGLFLGFGYYKYAAMNIHKQIFAWTYVFSFLGLIPRSGIVGSHSKFMFNFLRNTNYWNEVLKSPTNIMELFLPSVLSIFASCICEAFLFDIDIFTLLYLEGLALLSMCNVCLYLLQQFDFKFILSDVSIIITTLFGLLFTHKIFFCLLIFNSFVSLDLNLL